jgi:hypothetical protein
MNAARVKSQPQPQPETETIQIGETTYDANSVTERGVNIINDIRKIENLLAHQQLTVSVSSLAKTKLTEELEKEAVNFTKFPEVNSKK